MKLAVLKFILLPALAFSSALAHGLTSDREQPILVDADSLEVDEPKGISHYRGNVQITQGSLKVNAEEVIIYFIDGELDKLIITGNPARLQQRPDNSEEPVYSRAKRMEYFASGDVLYLMQDAEVRQGPNFFSGEHIEYDTRNSTVSAKSRGLESGRVRAVITPKKQADEPAP